MHVGEYSSRDRSMYICIIMYIGHSCIIIHQHDYNCGMCTCIIIHASTVCTFIHTCVRFNLHHHKDNTTSNSHTKQYHSQHQKSDVSRCKSDINYEYHTMNATLLISDRQLTFSSGEAPPDLNSGRGVDGDCGLVVKCCSRFHEREEEG